jgi:hypothetical protein
MFHRKINMGLLDDDGRVVVSLFFHLNISEALGVSCCCILDIGGGIINAADLCTKVFVCCLFGHEYFWEGYLPDGLIDRLRSIVSQEKNKFLFLFFFSSFLIFHT